MSDKQIYLAPMVGRTDEHYRSFIRILSKNIYLYTEMIVCDAFLHTNRKTYVVNETEKPLTIQLAGSDPEKFASCAKIIEKNGYSEINLNIGCPSNKVIKGNFGACLMKSPEVIANCIDKIKSVTNLAVSIKTRLGLGYDENLDLLRDLIEKSSNAGCTKFFVHARNAILDGISPKGNRKIPSLRYSDAFQIKNEFQNCQFFLNGGIEKIEDVTEQLKIFDGIMIGRKIYDDPNFLLMIEKDIYKNNNIPSRQEILENYLEYISNHKQQKNLSNYLLLRHLFSLYYNTSLSKKWKKFLHDIIQSNKDINYLVTFKC